MIEINIANIEDAQFIALLGRVTFSETFGHLFTDKNDLQNYCNKTFSVSKIHSSLKKSENIYYIAKVDQLPVGYAKLKLNSKSELITLDNVCQLQKIYVLKDFLSMKIGLKLQNTLLNTVKEKEYEQIWLSVLSNNDRAIRFYNKNGFKSIGNHDFHIGKEKFNFIAMSKAL